MKKILTSICILTLSLSVFAQQFSLGKVSFATDSVWVISGNGIKQIWSDAVQTENCSKKTSFDGGERNSAGYFIYKIDCRSNPEHKGDLFSGRAVEEFKNELCPKPWRVPTLKDLELLDIALGGTGEDQKNISHRNEYLNSWGGTYSGFSFFDGTLLSQGSVAYYWALSEFSEDFGVGMTFNIEGLVDPQMGFGKNGGFSLRCVRNN